MQVRTEYERSLFTDPLFSLQSPSSATLGTRGFSRVRREFLGVGLETGTQGRYGMIDTS